MHRESCAGSGWRTRHSAVWLLISLMLVPLGSGCVRRRLTIRTNPPGAVVYVDQQEIGITPVSTSFTYYDTRHVLIMKDGYQTVSVKHTLEPPWYEVPPLDFFSENFLPFEVRDERVLDFELVPQPTARPEELLERAENLRQSTQRGYTTPLVPGTVPPGTVVPSATSSYSTGGADPGFNRYSPQ